MNGRIPNLTDDQTEMVKGIAQILLGVKDLDNRMELAKDQIQKFKDEQIVFNYAGFLSMAGLDNSEEDVYMDIKTQPTHRVHKESTKLKTLLPLSELKLNDLVGNQYKYVIGNSDEKFLGPNDKKYVLGMIGRALEAYLYDGNFALNYLEGNERKEYNRFFETEVITPMLRKIDFTLDNFFKLEGDKVKWKFSPTDTRKMVDEIFRKNSKIPTDIKKAYYEYRLEYAGVKLKEVTLKGLEGVPSNKKLSQLSDKEKLDIVQSTGNIISFKVPDWAKNRQKFWQVISVGKVKKGKGLSNDTYYYLGGKGAEKASPKYPSIKDLLDGVDWDTMELKRESIEPIEEAMVRSVKDIVHTLIPKDTFGKFADDPKKNREWVNSLSKDMATLLNRFYKEHDINVVVKI